MNIESYYKLEDLKREWLSEILLKVSNKDLTFISILTINPTMYKRALNDFMMFGTVTRFPKKYIDSMSYKILQSISLILVTTELFGHTSSFPFDEVNDYLETDFNDYERASNHLEENGIDSIIPTFSNGQWLLTDYAYNSLEKFAVELLTTDDSTSNLITINKILDVVHQRSDLAEIFIKGGSDSLEQITN